MDHPTVTFTLIRHGESVDNTRWLWAGWKDSPLSNHGMNQAKALGAFFSDTRFTAIYSSTLQRALMTAQALREAQPHSQPSLTTSDLLREQHFGIAEGKPWALTREPGLSFADHTAKGVYPASYDRTDKFPEGESLNDLALRAETAVKELFLPYIHRAAKEGRKDIHVAVVSHGLCIGEIIRAITRMDASTEDMGKSLGGLANTAWARISVTIKGITHDNVETDGRLPLVVRLTDFNQHSHTDGIVRQPSGIGSAAYDKRQKDIRAFFSGERVKTVERRKPDSEEGTNDGR